MAVNRTDTFAFTDDVTTDKNSRMNSEMFRAIFSAYTLQKWKHIGQYLTVPTENYTKPI